MVRDVYKKILEIESVAKFLKNYEMRSTKNRRREEKKRDRDRKSATKDDGRTRSQPRWQWTKCPDANHYEKDDKLPYRNLV